MEKDEEELRKPEKRVEDIRNFVMSTPGSEVGGPGFVDVRKHREKPPKKAKWYVLAISLVPLLILIIILYIILYA